MKASNGRALSSTGHTVLELVVAMMIVLVLAGFSAPWVRGAVDEYRLHGATLYLRGLTRQVRARAASQGRYMAIVFDEDEAGEPSVSVHADGNGNGLRRADIAAGVDERLEGPWKLGERFPGVRYGSLPSGADDPGTPGLRIGRSRMLSFSPLGSSTSGTLFLSNQSGLVYAVIVYGGTARVRVARYRAKKWEAIP